MAKKHQYRASAAEKKKRQAEQQKQKSAAFWAKYKKPLFIGAIALVAVIFVIVLIINTNAAAGSIPMKNGELVGVQPNWLVDKLGGEKSRNYFKVAEVNVPDGYANKGGMVNDKLEQNFFLEPTMEDAMVENVIVMSMPKSSPAKLAEEFVGTGDYLLISDPMQVEIAGKNVHMKLITCAEYDMNPQNTATTDTGLYHMIATYTQAMKGGSVMVCLTTRNYPSMETLPSMEDIMDALEEIYAGITIM